jgi:hypothetical protein
MSIMDLHRISRLEYNGLILEREVASPGSGFANKAPFPVATTTDFPEMTPEALDSALYNLGSEL